MKPSDKNKLKMYTRRASLISGGMMLLSSALVGRMYYLQVTSRDKYELLAEQNRISMRLLAPTRGDIIDRYGRPIEPVQQITALMSFQKKPKSFKKH